MNQRQYIAIDLKSFYASVECVERGLDPLDTCLVVADRTRTEKTICLAVSPALKAYGTGGRPRLFEVIQRVNEANRNRGRSRRSWSKAVLDSDPQTAIDFISAPPRMALYIDYSTRIFDVYLRYIAPEDIHVYSIDEVFIDATAYLELYKTTAHNLAMKMIREVLAETGVTATAGIGSNMYLCKIAMDIVAKKMPPDRDGVRIAELDEMSYRRRLWDHTPLTDFWRVGRGIADRLALHDIRTMGDIALCSLRDEDLLYDLLGINAELLIDHAWGWEPVTIDLVKAYRPETHSISSGQVLTSPYTAAQARNVVMEMADSVSLELIEKGLVTDDFYGRRVPVHAHGTANLDCPTSSGRTLTEALMRLFDRIVNPLLLVRRLTVCLNRLAREGEVKSRSPAIQLHLFSDPEELQRQYEADRLAREKERRLQETQLRIKKMFGKNSILKGLNYAEGATQRDRNRQIGGHHE